MTTRNFQGERQDGGEMPGLSRAVPQTDGRRGVHVFRLFGPPSLFPPFIEIVLVIAATVPNTRRCGTVQGRRPFGCAAGAGSGGVAGSFSMQGL